MSDSIDYDLLAIQEMREAVRKAKEAQLKYKLFSQEQVDTVVRSVAEAACHKAYELAVLAVEETGMGVIEHKKLKNEVGSKSVFEWIKDEKTVGIIKEDRLNRLLEIAAPFGVVAAVIPTTNPTSTAIFKTLIALKTGNAIVASPHPSAVQCTLEALKICDKAAREAGAPEGLIGWLSYKSMEATQGLMKHPDTHLILATGGSGLVKAAYSSGKPAYGVGPGNVPVYIEKTANLQQAAAMIVDSKSFDHGTICASEQSIVADSVIYDSVIRELKRHGAYLLNPEEKRRVEKVLSPELGKINSKIVGKSAAYIARLAGIHVDKSVRVLVGEEREVGPEFPFSLEKLSPVLGLFMSENSKEAKEICTRLLDLGGRGHSFTIHTENEQVVRTFSLELPVSRILVNTLATMGAVGSTTALAPSFTLGCGTFGGNITGDNITARHLITTKRVAYGLKDVVIPKEGSDSHPMSSISVKNEEEQLNAIVKNVMAATVEKNGRVNEADVAIVVASVLKQLFYS